MNKSEFENLPYIEQDSYIQSFTELKILKNVLEILAGKSCACNDFLAKINGLDGWEAVEFADKLPFLRDATDALEYLKRIGVI